MPGKARPARRRAHPSCSCGSRGTGTRNAGLTWRTGGVPGEGRPLLRACSARTPPWDSSLHRMAPHAQCPVAPGAIEKWARSQAPGGGKGTEGQGLEGFHSDTGSRLGPVVSPCPHKADGSHHCSSDWSPSEIHQELTPHVSHTVSRVSTLPLARPSPLPSRPLVSFHRGQCHLCPPSALAKASDCSSY